MDTKDREPERSQYARLKKKYSSIIDKPKKGIFCEVKFFETHLCTELFFLYYFRYTSKMYAEQEPLLRDLNQCRDYRKKIDFFIKCRGLHPYFEKKGGSLSVAIDNSNRSIMERNAGNRNYSFSELGRMIEELRKLRM